MSCAYETELNARRKPSLRVWIEPLILLAIIIAYCMLMANRAADEQQARMTESAKDRQSICLLRQNNELHQFNCKVVNQTYARLD